MEMGVVWCVGKRCVERMMKWWRKVGTWVILVCEKMMEEMRGFWVWIWICCVWWGWFLESKGCWKNIKREEFIGGERLGYEWGEKIPFCPSIFCEVRRCGNLVSRYGKLPYKLEFYGERVWQLSKLPWQVAIHAEILWWESVATFQVAMESHLEFWEVVARWRGDLVKSPWKVTLNSEILADHEVTWWGDWG